jgi:hypothetical protein
MRMVLLENVQRLRMLFPFTLVGKPNTYSPERLLWYVATLSSTTSSPFCSAY